MWGGGVPPISYKVPKSYDDKMTPASTLTRSGFLLPSFSKLTFDVGRDFHIALC